MLKRLLRYFDLEKIELGLYRGRSYDPGWGRVFGGQVLGQALMAAQNTIPEDSAKTIHSFHSYFLRPGDVSVPIVYEVENVRDGSTISTRRVTAIQNGKKIFHLTGSFDSFSGGFEHNVEMPKVPGPDGLLAEHEHARNFVDRIPESLRTRFLSEQPIEARHVTFIDPCDPDIAEPIRHIWLRASDELPSNPKLHQCLLAFCSDYNLLSTALLPHGATFWAGNIASATIDHSMWFHREIKLDEWLLYSIESPVASNGRGLSRGQIFDQNGYLVASTAQEGIIRSKSTTRK